MISNSYVLQQDTRTSKASTSEHSDTRMTYPESDSLHRSLRWRTHLSCADASRSRRRKPRCRKVHSLWEMRHRRAWMVFANWLCCQTLTRRNDRGTASSPKLVRNVLEDGEKLLARPALCCLDSCSGTASRPRPSGSGL